MNIGSSRHREDPEISMVSLIDVVFTLVIFFVLTTTFRDRAALEIQLPEARSSAVAAVDEPLIVTVDRDGRYFVGGNEVLQPDAEALRAAVARVAGDDRQRPVIVRGDARAPYQAAITAMDVIGQLGFTRVSLATNTAKAAR